MQKKNSFTVLDQDMTDFRVKGKSLRWDFIIPTTRHSMALAPLSCPCVLLPQSIVEQSHSSNGWPSVHSVWGLLGLGGCRFAQIAIHRRVLCIPTPKAGMCIQIHRDVSPASARSVQVCITGPSSPARVERVCCHAPLLHVTSLSPLELQGRSVQFRPALLRKRQLPPLP